jgi:hypothetical protein
VTTASDLLRRIGFADGENGKFRAAARVELEPLGRLFFKLRVDLGDGSSISTVVHVRALSFKEVAPRGAREASTERITEES